jgi:hypothetical protein
MTTLRIMTQSITIHCIMTHSITTLCKMTLSILTLSMTVKAIDVMLAVVIRLLQRASSGQRWNYINGLVWNRFRIGHLTMYIQYTFHMAPWHSHVSTQHDNTQYNDTLITALSMTTLNKMTHSITTLCLMTFRILTLSMTVKAINVMLTVIIKLLQRASSGQRWNYINGLIWNSLEWPILLWTNFHAAIRHSHNGTQYNNHFLCLNVPCFQSFSHPLSILKNS